jgi:hypothetical protein
MTFLERIVKERVGQSLVGNVSVAAERLADEFVREAMADEDFRRSIREMVRTWGKELWEQVRQSSRPAGARRRRRSKR